MTPVPAVVARDVTASVDVAPSSSPGAASVMTPAGFPSRRALREAARAQEPVADTATVATVGTDTAPVAVSADAPAVSAEAHAEAVSPEPIVVPESDVRGTAFGSPADADEPASSFAATEATAFVTGAAYADEPQASVSAPSNARKSGRKAKGSKSSKKDARRAENVHQHAHRASRSRKPALVAGTAVVALIPGLMFAAPANAAESLTSQQLKDTIASNSKILTQSFKVSAAVSGDSVQTENYAAGALAGIVAAESGPDGAQVALALAAAFKNGGARERIVETALTYLGDPYALGGASHSGIDCSGLTMVAYAAAGVSLVHYVPSQDAVATTISEADAQPGDLVFFDDDEHVALYLGAGTIIEAPDYGIPVRIVSLSTWSGIGYHFGRILSD